LLFRSVTATHFAVVALVRETSKKSSRLGSSFQIG